MIKLLLRYDWSLLKDRLSDKDLIIGVFFFVIFAFMMWAAINNILLVVLFAKGAELPPEFNFVTPEIRFFILLVFANVWWISQLVATSPAMLRPVDHRPLLTHGVPIQYLGRYLLTLCFVHPLALFFNVGWIWFLVAWSGRGWALLFILPAIAVNQLVIFVVKERVHHLITQRFKRMALLVVIFVLIMSQQLLEDFNLPQTLEQLQNQIPIYVHWLSALPGSWLIYGTEAAGSWWLMSVLVIFLPAIWYLFEYLNNRVEQLIFHARTTGRARSSRQHPLWIRLRKLFGYNAGKGFYYLILHPYSQSVILVGIVLPLVYIPMFLKHDSPAGFFFVQIILFLPFLYVAMLLFANMFGFEHKEWLAHLQFPVDIQQQIEQRYIQYLLVLGGLFLPALFLLGIGSGGPIYVWIPRLLFVWALLLVLFRWPAFSYSNKVQWQAMSFRNPLFPTSVGIALGLLELLVIGIALIPAGRYQIYKSTLLLGVALFAFGNMWRWRGQFSIRFRKNILPSLWNRS